MTPLTQIFLIVGATIVALATLNTIDIIFGKHNRNKDEKKEK